MHENLNTRISTGKKFSQANLNFVEKNWHVILEEYFEKQKSLLQRAQTANISDLVEAALDALKETASNATIKSIEAF